MGARILVLNGPNLNLLGTREPEIYGAKTLDAIATELDALAPSLDLTLTHAQSNCEGQLIDWLQRLDTDFEGAVLNAGAYTHTSLALHDAIAAKTAPVIELHISNVHAREAIRHTTRIGPACWGSITGLGTDGYALALRALAGRLKPGC